MTTKKDDVLGARPSASNNRSVEFIRPSNLNGIDIFAASWWQSVPRFLEANVERDVENVEGDAFVPIQRAGRGMEDVRMTRDWLDMSVEHLSKWWKVAELQQDVMYAYAAGKLQSYVLRTLQQMRQEKTATSSSSAGLEQAGDIGNLDNVMRSTLALIPYGVADTADDATKQMWTISLASTMASLLKHGIGRILVVGHYDTDAILAKRAFRYLLRHASEITTPVEVDDHIQHNASSGLFSTQYGSTELAYVHTHDVKSMYDKINVPKGAMSGLQWALKGHNNTFDWLGSKPDQYKYIFFTESDQVLNARQMPTMIETLDEGRIIVPHRLQPYPHPVDLGDGMFGHPRIKESLTSLTQRTEDRMFHLSEEDSCCDTGEHLSSREGFDTFWWLYGFEGVGNFSHLREYNFMRLAGGTGIVSVSATEHSRKCHPTTNGKSCKDEVPIRGGGDWPRTGMVVAKCREKLPFTVPPGFGWEVTVYETCEEHPLENENEEKRVRVYLENADREECSSYLQYIIDNYNDLPDINIFLREDAVSPYEQGSAWQTPFGTIWALENATRSHILEKHGFLHYGMDVGQWGEKTNGDKPDISTLPYVRELWSDLGLDTAGATGATNQYRTETRRGNCFAVHRDRILSNPREFYSTLRKRLEDSYSEPSSVTKRRCAALEKTWHVVFGEPAILPKHSTLDAYLHEQGFEKGRLLHR